MGALALRRINLGYFAHISVRVWAVTRGQDSRSSTGLSLRGVQQPCFPKKYKSHVRVYGFTANYGADS